MAKKLRAPKGCTAFYHENVEYKVEDGHLVVPDHLAPLAESFGYGDKAASTEALAGMLQDVRKTADKLAADNIAKMGRGQLMGYCEDNKIQLPEGRLPDAKLREIVLAHSTSTLDIIKAAETAS